MLRKYVSVALRPALFDRCRGQRALANVMIIGNALLYEYKSKTRFNVCIRAESRLKNIKIKTFETKLGYTCLECSSLNFESEFHIKSVTLLVE